MDNDKTLKQIDNFRFQVSLKQQTDGKYVVYYESKVYGVPSKSESVDDYKIASFLFDVKLAELEGN